MANDIKIRFRHYLPGAGVNSSGTAKQGKTRTVGTISVTSYVSGGETISPQDLGLSAIDAVRFRISEETSSTDAASVRRVVYNQSDDRFYLVNVDRTGITDEYADAATETIEFVADGDSANDVELT